MFPTRRITTSGDKFRNDNSIFLDGVDDWIHVNTTNGTFAESNGDFNTISIWVKIDSNTGGATRIWNTASSNPGLMIQKGDSNTEIGYNTGNSERIGVELPNSQVLDRWINIIMSFERNSVSNDTALDNVSTGELYPLMWIDGVRQSVSYVSSTTDSNSADVNQGSDLFIGSNAGLGSNNSQALTGYVADCAIYKGVKFTNSMAKTVYNDREPFDHTDWSVGAKYLSMWTACGGAGQDAKGVYGPMTDLIADDASNGANLYSDDNSEFLFSSESVAAGTDSYDVAANSLITTTNATALIEQSSGTHHMLITNTGSAYGTANISVTCEANTLYRFYIEYRAENSAHSTHNLKIDVNAPNEGGGSNISTAVTTVSNQDFGRRIETGGSQTTLTFNFGPNSNSSGDKIAIVRFRLNKISNVLSLENLQKSNASTVEGVGMPTIEGDSPFGG
tara:strand:+ start:2442 stop:3785 length:1344 start_codon:yes stop_codon:yes gene_type:complete